MGSQYLALLPLGAFLAWGASLPSNRASDIVQRSVNHTNEDWAAAPQYDFTEHDVNVRHGIRTVKTYRVLMIDGSPYNRTIAIDGQPLSAGESAGEDHKLQEETARRRAESAIARRKRIAQYERERDQDHALMSEMVRDFDYKLDGEATVNGRKCFVLDATPKPG